MPTVFSFSATLFTCLIGLILNFLFNYIFKLEGYAIFTAYLILINHKLYKNIEKFSKLIVINIENIIKETLQNKGDNK